MTAAVSTNVLLVSGYSVFLLAVAYGFDVMARRVAVRARRWRTGSFRYHPDHDAWMCPQDQWLWPTSYDPEQRIMRYRGQTRGLQRLPGQERLHDLATRPGGDPGDRSLAALRSRSLPPRHRLSRRTDRRLPAARHAGVPAQSDGSAGSAGDDRRGRPGGVPLARHLWRTPSGFPEHIPQQAVYEEPPRDRFATRWGSARNRTTSREL